MPTDKSYAVDKRALSSLSYWEACALTLGSHWAVDFVLAKRHVGSSIHASLGGRRDDFADENLKTVCFMAQDAYPLDRMNLRQQLSPVACQDRSQEEVV